jgi:hypothetical protein
MGISVSKANMWCTSAAEDIAADIVNRVSTPRLYCGPAAVAWIAAVWNRKVKRPYDYLKRLANKSLFPDGPRDFTDEYSLALLGLKKAVLKEDLRSVLLRETEGELTLGKSTHYRYGTIHDKLEEMDYPIIIRMGSSEFWNGLHYVTLYQSDKENRRLKLDRIKFHWQDNGFYGRSNGGNGGLYVTAWRDVGQSAFAWGSKQVVPTMKGMVKLAQS